LRQQVLTVVFLGTCSKWVSSQTRERFSKGSQNRAGDRAAVNFQFDSGEER
jgi:hypothetical protein